MSSLENRFCDSLGRNFRLDFRERWELLAFIAAKAIDDRYFGTIQTAVTKHTWIATDRVYV